MLRDNLTAFFSLYFSPGRAVSQILDRGRLWFAVVAALGLSFLLHVSGQPPSAGLAAPGWMTVALMRFISFSPGGYLAPLLVVAIVLVPALIFFRAIAGYGSFGVLMRSDYASLLMAMLMCWAAAYLPLTVAHFAIDSEWLAMPLFYLAANLYFFALAACALRTVFGIGFGPALGLAAAGWVAGIAGAGLFTLIGSVSYYLMSPFLLYYLYMMLGSDVRSLGEGLRSRQHLRQQLEIATNNPHDADAHYQLGLIYQQRRQLTQAISHFQRALAIDPGEADPHYQLGRMARAQGRAEDAIRHLKEAARIDDKLALSDVWRELGAALLDASHTVEAASALEKFTSRRPYDPEGLYWHGKVLMALDRRSEAKDLFERSIEAVRTMPSNRRAQVRMWASRAQADLRKLAHS